MSFLNDTIETEEFRLLSPEEKSLKAKDLFGETLKQSETLLTQFSEFDAEGKQNMLTNFRGALVKRFPDQFTKNSRVGDLDPDRPREGETIITESGEERFIPGPELTGLPGPAQFVPILDPRSEKFISLIDSGEITPESYLPEGKELKDFTTEDLNTIAITTGIVNNLVKQGHLAKHKGKEFTDFANKILTDTQGITMGETKFKAAARGALPLKFASDIIAETARGLEAIEKRLGIIDEPEVSIEERKSKFNPFTSLEMAARGEEIQSATTKGAISFAILTGVAGGSAILRSSLSAPAKLATTVALEAGIGLAIEDALPPITAELVGAEPGSFESKALSTLEGALIGTIATLLPRSSRQELGKAFREVFGELQSVKVAVPTAKTISADAAVIAKRYGVPIEDAQKVADKIFGKGFQPLARREEVVALEAKNRQVAAQKLKEDLAGREAKTGQFNTTQRTSKSGNAVEELTNFDGRSQRIDMNETRSRESVPGTEVDELKPGDVVAENLDALKGPDPELAQVFIVRRVVKNPDGTVNHYITMKVDPITGKVGEGIEQAPSNVHRDINDPEVQIFKVPKAEAKALAVPIVSPKQAASDISTAQGIDNVMTPVDVAINRARLRKGQPVTPEARRAQRQTELEITIGRAEPDKAAEAQAIAQADVAKTKADTQSLFDATKVDESTAHRINQVENTKGLSRTEKDELIIAARSGNRSFNAKLEKIAIRSSDDVIQELDELKRARKPEGKLSVEDVNTARTSLRLAQDIDEVSKLNKNQINQLLINPLPVSQLRNASKGKLLDRFELEKNDSIIRQQEQAAETAEAQKFDHDPDHRLEDSVQAEFDFADVEFNPSRTTKAAHKIEVDSPQNPNKPVSDTAKPSTQLDEAEVAGKQREEVGNETTKVEEFGSDTAYAAHQRVVDRLSLGIIQGKNSGKGLSGALNAEMLRDLVTVGADLIGRGVSKFADWSTEMIKRYGSDIRGSLGDLWDSAKRAFNNIKHPISNSHNAVDDAGKWTKDINESASRKFAKIGIVRAIDHLSSPVMTRIARISKKIKGRIQLMEFEINRVTNESLKRADNFVTGMSEFEKADRVLFNEVDRAFMNSDIAGARELIVKSELKGELKDKILKGIDETQDVLKDLRDRGNALGMDIGYVEGYMPRMVKDHKGLLKSMGIEQRTAVEKIWAEEAKRINRNLTSAERAELANRYLQRNATGGGQGKLSLEKQRVFDEISENMQPYYGKTHENVMHYITQMENRLAIQKAFGRDMKVAIRKTEKTETVTMADGSKMQRVVDSPQQLVDYNDQSIGALIDEVNPNLKFEDRRELLGLVKSRFQGGESSALDFVQNLRNIGYVATIGKYANSLTQVGDLFQTVQKRPRSFLHGTKQGSFLKNADAVDTMQLGINRVMEEHNVSPMRTARLFDSIITKTGFKRIDRFGKDTFLNATWDDFQKIVKGKRSKKALEKFTQEHTELFGEEFTDKLIKDLKVGKRSYETDAALFNELTGIQPLTKGEMPAAYLNNPNMRIFYMLKTFTLKQLDRIRREGIDELLDATDDFRAGRKGEAAKRASVAVMKIGLIAGGGAAFEAGTSDILKDVFRGKPVTQETVSDAAIANLLRFVFMNKHTLRRFGSKGDGALETWANNMLPPAVSIVDQGIHDGMLLLDGELTWANAESTYSIPFAGDLGWWFSETGRKRVKEIEEDIEQRRDPLFSNIVTEQRKSRKSSADLNSMVDGHIIHLEDLRNDRDRGRYLQKIKVDDPVMWKKTFQKWRAKKGNEARGLTQSELKFKSQASDVRAAQIAKVINAMSTGRQKKEFYSEMVRKRIITKSVKRLLDPQLKGIK